MKPTLILCSLVLSVVLSARADELDDLLAKVNPPARFKDHQPRWSVKERTFAYQEFEGEVQVDACNVATLAVHPQLGYTVDVNFDGWITSTSAPGMYMEAGPSGRHSPRPDEFACYRVAISRVGKDGFEGYPANVGGTSQHRNDFLCRDGGIMAFLNDRTGWSPTYVSNAGIESRLVVCGPHTDLDVSLNMAKIVREQKDGLNRYVVHNRLVALPPEMTKYVWDNMNLLHKGETKLLLQVGQREDFEDQPLDICSYRKGLKIHGNANVTTNEAHSGKKSLQFTGTLSNGDPTLCLRPNRTYRLEAWLKAVPTAKESGGRAYITMAYAKYDMDPPVAPPQQTTVATANNEWQHVVLDFTSPKWGPSLRLKFVAEGCSVFMDDFQLALVQPATR